MNCIALFTAWKWEIIVATVVLKFRICSATEFITEIADLDFEIYISKAQLPSTCALFVLKQGPVHFKPLQRPTFVYTVPDSVTFKHVILNQQCNIVVLLGIRHEECLADCDRFIGNNSWKIKLVLIFPMKPFQLKDLKSLSLNNLFHTHLVLIDSRGNITGEIKTGMCFYEDPRCFLKGSFLKVGFTNSLPYFHLRGWNKTLSSNKESKTMPLFRVNKSGYKIDESRFVIDGVEGQLLRLIMIRYNLKVTMIAPPDNEYGIKQTNGNWSGKLGSLARGEVDLVVGMIPGNYERLEVGNYLSYLFYAKFVLSSRYTPSQVSWLAPFRPFSLPIWIMLLLSPILIGVQIWWISRVHYRISTALPSSKDSVSFAIIPHLFKLLIDQPILKIPDGPASLVVTSWLILILIFQSVYSSNFTARLSIPDKQTHVNSVKDVWELKKTLLVYKGGTVQLYLNSSKDPYVKLVYGRRTQYTGDITNFTVAVFDDCNLVATSERGTFKTNLQGLGRNPLHYHYSSEALIKIFCSWLTSKDLRIGPALSTLILRAETAGLMSKWYSDRLNSGGRRGRRATSDYADENIGTGVSHHNDAVLMLSHLRGLFMLWSLGIFLSVLIFLAELLILRISRRNFVFEYLE